MAMKLRFYFDVVSPYSFLAFRALKNQKSWQKIMKIELSPIFLGGIMQKSKNSGPGLHQLKAQYMQKDLKYMGSLFGINDFAIPYNMGEILFSSRSTIDAQRMLLMVNEYEGFEACMAVSDAFFDYIWTSDGKTDIEAGLDSFLNILRVSEKVSRQTLEQVNETMKSQEDYAKVKARLTEKTNEAVDKFGIFGAPSFVVWDNEKNDNWKMFFGADRLFALASLYNLPFEGLNLKLKL